ncbi:hypothetical protein FRC12_012777 [Ceratobasidium sp. 428]|nr:hypothetical protein FRC12_012777 [Ceratobasidium sp. 428]
MWDNYWGKRNTDGKITWGPDAELTELGKYQAKKAAQTWITEMSRLDPVPLASNIAQLSLIIATFIVESTRYHTANETLLIAPLPRHPNSRTHILRNPQTHVRPSVYHRGKTPSPLQNLKTNLLEIQKDLREMIGIHTTDKRRSKSYIQQTFPNFDIEPGFSEEDELWTPTTRETDAEMEPRLKRALDHIFGSLLDEDDTYISVTAHSGTIAAALRVLGHREYRLPTGGVVPVVIRATPM